MNDIKNSNPQQYHKLYFVTKGLKVTGEVSYTVGITGEQPETLYHRDDALLYITYVMLIWAAPIPADRWHCSLGP